MFNKIWEKILIKAIISEINPLKRCDVLPIFEKVKKKNWRQKRNLIFFIFRLHFASDLWDKRRGRRAFNAWRRPSTTTWVRTSQLEASIRTSKRLWIASEKVFLKIFQLTFQTSFQTSFEASFQTLFETSFNWRPSVKSD